jgi:alkaline phosphatase D
VKRKRGLFILVAALVVSIGAWFWLGRANGVIGDQADASPANPGIFRIAFGSCAKQWKPNYMWRAILNCKPDIWIWLGDSVYADTEDMAYLKSQYEIEKRNPEYRELMKTCRIIGTWDDNDYGMRNGDGSYPKKAESEQIYLDFLDEPSDSPRRKQNGVYASYVFGEPGKQTKIILLDLRYNSDEPMPEGDLLGEAQWAWLASELEGTQDELVILGSSIQLLSSEHPYDHWGNYPKARTRMLNLIAGARPKLTVILSGDRHLGEISRSDDSGLAYPLYDITSSGLTHHVDFVYHLRCLFSPERNRYRVGTLFYEKNFGIVDVDWSTGSPVLSLQIGDRKTTSSARPRSPAFKTGFSEADN